MSLKKDRPRRQKLNEGLCPDDFEIYVPQSCKLLGHDMTRKEEWIKYLQTLDRDLTAEDAVHCYSHDCQDAWKLTGPLAIAHACVVHDKIHRQALALDQVSAVDVGFAIWERERRFGNFLAIRIHVNRKQAPEQLVRRGFESFSRPPVTLLRVDLRQAADNARGNQDVQSFQGDRECQPGRDCRCPNHEKWKLLQELLRQERRRGDSRRPRLARYPIGGVHDLDFSIYCPPEVTDIRSLDDVRLCICGVPIDIINARYGPATLHPGGDSERGVFVEELQRANQLEDGEQLLIGRGRVNPLVGGLSIGSVTGQAGTLSTIVWDRTDGTPCALSNWHVLAGTATAQVGQPAYQPALFDGGTVNDEVAHLKRWHLGEEGDAALAELSRSRHYASGEILGIWHPISGYMKPRLNMEVRKWGRTTGFTQGFVDGFYLATNIDYGNEVVRYFREQFHIAPLFLGEDVSQVGDSGSLVLTSVRPLDLQSNLECVFDWLQKLCAVHGGAALCREVQQTLEKLEERSLALEGCEAICDLLAGCPIECPPDGMNPTTLCTTIRSTLEEVAKECRRQNTLLDSLKRSEALIERCLEVHCDRHDLATWQKEIKQASGSLRDAVPASLKVLNEETVGDLAEAMAGKISQRKWCRLLNQAHQCVVEKIAQLKSCLRFCREVEEVFGKWHRQCDTAKTAKDLADRICLLLSMACHESCHDPVEAIRCIKECLSRIECEDPSISLERLAELVCDGGCDQPYPSCDDFEMAFYRCLEEWGIGYNPSMLKKPAYMALKKRCLDTDSLEAIQYHIEEYCREREDRLARNATRAHFAVGMIFAGDTPGSPLGEFAVASDIEILADELRFSLRPVFEPRSSFRELRVRPPAPSPRGGVLQSIRGLGPGDQSSDPRGGGPQPDVEPAQGDAGGGSGGPST